MKRKLKSIIFAIILIMASNLFAFSAFAASDPSTGCVDFLNQNITGWVYNPSNPNKSIQVHVYIYRQDGSLVWCTGVTASNFRQDLYNLGWGNGNHGFSFSIPWDTFDWGSIPGYLLDVTAYAVDDAYPYHPTIFNSTSIQNPVHAGSLTWPISDIHYYLYDTTYATEIQNAATNWAYTGCGWNKLLPCDRTYANNNSAMDIFSYSDSTDGNNGYTYFFTANGNQVYPWLPFSDYRYSSINLNNYNISTNPNSPNYVQSVVSHEMGHVFGLDENNNNTSSIMCQAGHGRLADVRGVQFVDNYAFNIKNP